MAFPRAVSRRLSSLLFFLLVLLGGCTYYEVAPGSYSTVPSSGFDRSWSAVLGAFDDVGVRVTHEDRGMGEVRGTRDGIVVTASVLTQADRSVRVAFRTSGTPEGHPDLIDHLTSAYHRRMGR